jgi:type II restriction enzyme
MMRALRSDSIPNLLVMQYTPEWVVHNLLLIPSFFFSPAAIQKRKPLNPKARRAGWVGCNILLSEIANDGKIRMISQGVPLPPDTVRMRYNFVRPLSQVAANMRGWTLDVLRIIREMGKTRFCLANVYAFESALADIYPDNKNVRPKIRPQLQVLRDLG